MNSWWAIKLQTLLILPLFWWVNKAIPNVLIVSQIQGPFEAELVWGWGVTFCYFVTEYSVEIFDLWSQFPRNFNPHVRSAFFDFGLKYWGIKCRRFRSHIPKWRSPKSEDTPAHRARIHQPTEPSPGVSGYTRCSSHLSTMILSTRRGKERSHVIMSNYWHALSRPRVGSLSPDAVSVIRCTAGEEEGSQGV